MMRVLLLGLLALAACTEVPTSPEPSNPFDPGFGGARHVSTPPDLRLVDTPGLDLTLAWTDSSTFEAGYRVERALPVGPGGELSFSTVAVVGPDVTTVTLAEPATAEGTLYRVVGMGGGRDRDSLPSDVLHVAVPVQVVRVDQSALRGGALSSDGSTLYAVVSVEPSRRGVAAVDATTGRTRWVVPDVDFVLRVLTDGRMVGLTDSSPIRLVLTSPSGAVQRDVALENSFGCAVGGVDDAVSRAVGACFGELAVWDLADGSRIEPPTPAGAGAWAVSPDARFAAARKGDRLEGYDVAGQRVLWNQPWCYNGVITLSADGLALTTECGSAPRLLQMQTGQALSDAVPPTVSRFDKSGTVLYGSDREFVQSGPYAVRDVVTVWAPGSGGRARSYGVLSEGESFSAVASLPGDGLVLFAPSARSLFRWDSGSRWQLAL